jgi:hypothetical protein
VTAVNRVRDVWTHMLTENHEYDTVWKGRLKVNHQINSSAKTLVLDLRGHINMRRFNLFS